MSEGKGTARATDGYELTVTRFPAEGKAWGSVLVAGAMGVRQDFYAPFARFLAQHGLNVLTFDYRGSGWSRPKDLAKLDVNVTDWATKDLGAMIAEAHNPAPHLPLIVIGHSLGGQILGIAPGNASVRAAVNVTAGSGYYRFNDRMRLRVRLLWFVAFPLLTPLFGYFPGKKLRMVGDLPRGVARQWRRWCLHPQYLMSEGEEARKAFDRVTAPIVSYSFEDDPMITRAAVASLNSFYRKAHLEHRHVTPAEIGERHIGHFGFFSERRRADLWQDVRDWLYREISPEAVSTVMEGARP